MNSQSVKPEYVAAIKVALSQQLPTLVICPLLLDFDQTLRVCLIALLGFWLFAMLCLARSERGQDPVGLLFLRWGFMPLFGVLCLVNDQFHPIHGR